MNNTNLKSLLVEYDNKRRLAEDIANRNKEALYEEFPNLAEIDKKINTLALSTIKQIALNGNQELVSSLNEQIEALKKEKATILASISDKADSIFPHYECSKCNDTGYILENRSNADV